MWLGNFNNLILLKSYVQWSWCRRDYYGSSFVVPPNRLIVTLVTCVTRWRCCYYTCFFLVLPGWDIEIDDFSYPIVVLVKGRRDIFAAVVVLLLLMSMALLLPLPLIFLSVKRETSTIRNNHNWCIIWTDIFQCQSTNELEAVVRQNTYHRVFATEQPLLGILINKQKSTVRHLHQMVVLS